LTAYVAVGYIGCVKEVTYTRAAIRVLRRMPANVAARIEAKIREYAADPAALANNVAALKGREGVRLRIGDWRVIMHDGVVLAVLDIGPRGDIYD
jgi:mRNA interferase RelE/StbE